MRVRLYSLQAVRRGDWLIKASTFDDQILLFLLNEYTLEYRTVMFYSEEAAHYFIESLYD